MIKNYNSEQKFIKDGVGLISEYIKQDVAEKGKAYVGLSGGSTPIPFYKELSKLEEGNVEYYVVDERKVPYDHENSNYKMIQDTLSPSKLSDFKTDLPVEKSLSDYASKLPQQFDLLILGIGEDGHFASIFPGTDLSTNQSVIYSETERFDVKQRLSMSAKTIMAARRLIVLLKNKAAVIEELKSGNKPIAQFPSKILLNHPCLEILYLE
ncbi:hypothetical protein GF376_02275 [Candidatus Peregrinibacteria bacterium]|nr:hypothetical protein [Candidatus Peregrinibacteria bacterium]